MAEACSSSQQIPYFEDYESDFEYDAEVGEKRKARQDLAVKSVERKQFKPNKSVFHEECSKEQGRFQQKAFLALDVYTRHKKLINEYVLCYRGATDKIKRNTCNYKTDYDIIRENHRFLWEEDDEATSWEQQLAKKYYDRLFKEYCLCDLSRYKDKKIGMRWRTEKELIIGKGQFFCGNIHCEKNDNLNSWEVLFGYIEQGGKKSALVKLRLCDRCSEKLHCGYKGKAVLKKKHSKTKKLEKNSDDEKVNVGNACDKTTSETSKSDDLNESDIWKQPVKEDVEPSKEDVFEEFLEDLFL